jgi:hypothetical protein
MSEYTNAQLKTWKNEEMGKLFFSYLQSYVDERKKILTSLDVKSLDMEKFFKLSLTLKTQIELIEEIITSKIEHIVEEKEDEKSNASS